MLKEDIEHHVEEEAEMFKNARQVLSEEEIETLGNHFKRLRGKTGRQPRPNRTKPEVEI